MPSLILSSRYTTDSQILREAARSLGWETLRLDGEDLPEWFDPRDDQIAMYYTAPHAFDVASQLDRRLVGCSPDWTVSLPFPFLSRTIRQTTLDDALQIAQPQFVKHSVSKAFPAAVYTADSLARATEKIPIRSLVHVGEPVEFDVEYRCFVSEGGIRTMSPYLRFGEAVTSHSVPADCPQEEIKAARRFAESVLASSDVHCPPAFVLDVGLIHGRGWAVVECNECWASGIYACNPELVLHTVLRACIPTQLVEGAWDFQQHYSEACSR